MNLSWGGMAKLLLYSLATICFAASLGGLTLWGWSASREAQRYSVTWRTTTRSISVSAFNGTALACDRRGNYSASRIKNEVVIDSADLHGLSLQFYQILSGIGHSGNMLYFPLWYAALVFALVGVGIPRIRRQFSIRSVFMSLTIVAALLGMAIAL